ncbi:ANTAR domain-containing protein [Streptomyces sp. NPDC091272]|uniref:ANTAR domain-containing protein n=1 Tax=Streptomyces sp. NPDC091272 TaxID=3365981 RepID=UPI00382E5ED6
MSSQQRVMDILVEAVDTLTHDFDLIDFLHRLSTRCVELLDVDAAGVLLVDEFGQLQLIAASDERTRLLELFALQHEQGPCVSCYRTGQGQLNIDLTSPVATAGFGPFAQRARERGFVRTHALPLRLREEVIGALNLFSTRPERLSAQDLTVGQALSDVATIAILQQRTIARGDIERAQLQSALHSRIVIEQAKGILSERQSIELDAAFDALRSYARHHQLRITDLASQIIDNDPPRDFPLPPRP